MKKNYLIIFLCAFVIVTIVFIFLNSLRNAGESNNNSNPIAQVIQSLIDPNHHIELSIFNAIVRKAAHVCEFGILGSFLMGSALVLRKEKNLSIYNVVFGPSFIALAIGVIDEFVQSFSPERASLISDVLIDFAGAAFGMLLVSIVYALFRSRRKRRLVQN